MQHIPPQQDYTQRASLSNAQYQNWPQQPTSNDYYTSSSSETQNYPPGINQTPYATVPIQQPDVSIPDSSTIRNTPFQQPQQQYYQQQQQISSTVNTLGNYGGTNDGSAYPYSSMQHLPEMQPVDYNIPQISNQAPYHQMSNDRPEGNSIPIHQNSSYYTQPQQQQYIQPHAIPNYSQMKPNMPNPQVHHPRVDYSNSQHFHQNTNRQNYGDSNRSFSDSSNYQKNQPTFERPRQRMWRNDDRNIDNSISAAKRKAREISENIGQRDRNNDRFSFRNRDQRSYESSYQRPSQHRGAFRNQRRDDHSQPAISTFSQSNVKPEPVNYNRDQSNDHNHETTFTLKGPQNLDQMRASRLKAIEEREKSGNALPPLSKGQDDSNFTPSSHKPYLDRNSARPGMYRGRQHENRKNNYRDFRANTRDKWSTADYRSNQNRPENYRSDANRRDYHSNRGHSRRNEDFRRADNRRDYKTMDYRSRSRSRRTDRRKSREHRSESPADKIPKGPEDLTKDEFGREMIQEKE